MCRRGIVSGPVHNTPTVPSSPWLLPGRSSRPPAGSGGHPAPASVGGLDLPGVFRVRAPGWFPQAWAAARRRRRAPSPARPVPSSGIVAGSGTALAAAETVPETLEVKPCSVLPAMAAGWVTSAKPKLSARGSARILPGSTPEVKVTVPGGSEAERVSDEPPPVPNTKSVKAAVR